MGSFEFFFKFCWKCGIFPIATTFRGADALPRYIIGPSKAWKLRFTNVRIFAELLTALWLDFQKWNFNWTDGLEKDLWGGLKLKSKFFTANYGSYMRNILVNAHADAECVEWMDKVHTIKIDTRIQWKRIKMGDDRIASARFRRKIHAVNGKVNMMHAYVMHISLRLAFIALRRLFHRIAAEYMAYI